MARFRVTPKADAHLQIISRYTLERWGAEQRDKYLKELDQRFHWLADHPRLGRHRPDLEKGYYCFPQGEHRIYYLIRKGGIDIIGVLHKHADDEGHFT